MWRSSTSTSHYESAQLTLIDWANKFFAVMSTGYCAVGSRLQPRSGAGGECHCRPSTHRGVQTSEMPLCARGGAVKGWLRPVPTANVRLPQLPVAVSSARRVGICATAAVLLLALWLRQCPAVAAAYAVCAYGGNPGNRMPRPNKTCRRSALTFTPPAPDRGWSLLVLRPVVPIC